MLQTGTKIIWGIRKDLLPALPPGFTPVMKDCCEARAVAPDGKEYVIALDPPRLLPIGSNWTPDNSIKL